MVDIEDLQKLFRYTVNHDFVDPGPGFVNLEIDGELVYQYNIGGIHNFVRVKEGAYSRIKQFAESSGYEMTMAEEPDDDEYHPEGTLTIQGEDDAKADIELFKKFLDMANFSLSEVDDAYFPIDEEGYTDVRPEDLPE